MLRTLAIAAFFSAMAYFSYVSAEATVDNPLGLHPILAEPLTEGEQAYIRGDHQKSNDTKEITIETEDGREIKLTIKEEN